MIRRRAAIHLAALTGPILVVQGFRMISGAAPATVVAADLQEDPLLAALAVTPAPQATARQQAAMGWLRQQDRNIVESPMNHGAPPIVVEATPIERVEPPTLTVSSIVNGSGGVIATINNRGRRIGDSLGAGWTVREIDFHKRSVLIGHTSGATARAYLSEIGHDLE